MAVLLLCRASTFVAADVSPGVVQYAHDRLTIHVVAMPLPAFLAELERQSGATVRGVVPDRTVTADLVNAPLTDALDTILGAESFMLTYGSDGSLRAIEMLAAGTVVAPTPAATPTSAAHETTRKPLAEEERQAAVLQRRVSVSAALGRAVGEEEPSVGRLLHAVLGERGAALRAEAREAVLAAFARDPETEAAYLSTLQPVDDAILARTFGAQSVDGSAEEWLTALAARARSQELRDKATAVLDVLREGRQ